MKLPPLLLLLPAHAACASPSRPERLEQLARFHIDFADARWTPRYTNHTAVIDPSVDWGRWEGWGTSLCWWSQAFGQRDDLADLLFTTKSTTHGASSLPGLGLNIARYNAGGSAWRAVNGTEMQPSPNIPRSRQIQGFWADPYNASPSSASWDWSADKNQVAMLRKAHARGANLFELFSNSPMWWQCSNHNPSGSKQGTRDNLLPRNWDRHAAYMAAVAEHAAETWGIQFDSVEPFNEPISDWWTSENNQEGCHFARPTQAVLIRTLRAELDARDLNGVEVAASDENTYTEALQTWQSFDADTQARIGRVNVHGYEQQDGRRDLLRAAAYGKRLWNSEYGDGDASGMSLAANLNLDLRWLHNTAWVYWQALDQGGWGLLASDLDASRVGRANRKYFVLAHYTRHIRPGMTIIDGGDDDTVAAFDAAARKLVIVAANYGRERRITYDLSHFRTVGGPVTRWCTNTQGRNRYTKHHDVVLRAGASFTARFSKFTVQTFEVENVDPVSAIIV